MIPPGIPVLSQPLQMRYSRTVKLKVKIYQTFGQVEAAILQLTSTSKKKIFMIPRIDTKWLYAFIIRTKLVGRNWLLKK